jgi:hypothetical protein
MVSFEMTEMISSEMVFSEMSEIVDFEILAFEMTERVVYISSSMFLQTQHFLFQDMLKQLYNPMK